MKEDMIITLDNDKEYYVLDSIIANNDNYIMISEIDDKTNDLTSNVKIMYYNPYDNVIKKVTNPNTLYRLTKMFSDKFAQSME